MLENGFTLENVADDSNAINGEVFDTITKALEWKCIVEETNKEMLKKGEIDQKEIITVASCEYKGDTIYSSHQLSEKEIEYYLNDERRQ